MESNLNPELRQYLGSVYPVAPLSFRRLKTVLEKVVPAFKINQAGFLPLLQNRAQVWLEHLFPSCMNLLMLGAAVSTGHVLGGSRSLGAAGRGGGPAPTSSCPVQLLQSDCRWHIRWSTTGSCSNTVN